MKFVVAVDGSEPSEDALVHALDIAEGLGGSVTAVHAVDPQVYNQGASEPIADLADAERTLVVEDLEDAEARGAELLGDAVEVAREQGAEIETELLYGDPVEVLPEFADDGGYDGLYVGHRGLGERYERLLGSVAKQLVAVAEVPVTVVH